MKLIPAANAMSKKKAKMIYVWIFDNIAEYHISGKISSLHGA